MLFFWRGKSLFGRDVWFIALILREGGYIATCLSFQKALNEPWLPAGCWNVQTANKDVVGKMFFLSLGTLTYPPCPLDTLLSIAPYQKTTYRCLIIASLMLMILVFKVLSGYKIWYQHVSTKCVCVVWKNWSWFIIVPNCFKHILFEKF